MLWPEPLLPDVGNQVWGADLPRGQISNCQSRAPIARGRHTLKKHIPYQNKFIFGKQHPLQKQDTHCLYGPSYRGKAQPNALRCSRVGSAVLRHLGGLPSLAGAAEWQPGCLWIVPAMLCSRTQSPKDDSAVGSKCERTRAPHTVTCNMRMPHTHTQRVLSLIHSLTHTRTHTVMAHTCNAFSHNMLPYVTYSPIQAHIFQCTCLNPLTCTHCHTHRCKYPHRLTVTRPCASPKCLHTSMQIEKVT